MELYHVLISLEGEAWGRLYIESYSLSYLLVMPSTFPFSLRYGAVSSTGLAPPTTPQIGTHYTSSMCLDSGYDSDAREGKYG